MKTLIRILLFVFVVPFLSHCEKDEPEPNENWVIGADWIDIRDGNTYATIPIGDQVWMAENMAYLPSVYNVEDGSEDEGNESEPFYYVLGYDGAEVSDAKASSNYSTYGVLYNWFAAQEACPDGWHLPSDEEWRELEIYLGGSDIAGLKLKATWGWDFNKWRDCYGNGTNESGFTALPGGGRYFDYQDPYQNTYKFSDPGLGGSWWSASEAYSQVEETYVYSRYLNSSRDNVWKWGLLKHEALSVRCIKD